MVADARGAVLGIVVGGVTDVRGGRESMAPADGKAQSCTSETSSPSSASKTMLSRCVQQKQHWLSKSPP